MATDISAPLPDLHARPNTLYTVTTGAAAVKVTQIVVHGRQKVPANLSSYVPEPTLVRVVPGA